MENVSTGVLEKIKNIIQVKIKPKNGVMYQDICNCICQNKKKWKFTTHYIKPTAQLLFKSRFSKGGPTCRRQVVNPRHQTPQEQLVAKPEYLGSMYRNLQGRFTGSGSIVWLSSGGGGELQMNHLPRDKLAAISQTRNSGAFLWLQNFVFWIKFHWSLFVRVQLTITQRWLR